MTLYLATLSLSKERAGTERSAVSVKLFHDGFDVSSGFGA